MWDSWFSTCYLSSFVPEFSTCREHLPETSLLAFQDQFIMSAATVAQSNTVISQEDALKLVAVIAEKERVKAKKQVNSTTLVNNIKASTFFKHNWDDLLCEIKVLEPLSSQLILV